jgi:hypothetical protein
MFPHLAAKKNRDDLNRMCRLLETGVTETGISTLKSALCVDIQNSLRKTTSEVDETNWMFENNPSARAFFKHTTSL